MLYKFIRFGLRTFRNCLNEFLDATSLDCIDRNRRNSLFGKMFDPCARCRLIRKISFIKDNNARLPSDDLTQYRIRRTHRNPCIEKFHHHIDEFQILLDQTLRLAHVPWVPLEAWNIDYVVIISHYIFSFRGMVLLYFLL